MMMDILSGLLVAFGMYSALPLPTVEWKRNTMQYALGFLPLIGIMIGVFQYGWLIAARFFDLHSTLYASIAIAIPVLITGGIHLDGLIDTCDAICSYGNMEKKLDILKDPHVGAFGILWIMIFFILQFGFFTQLYIMPEYFIILSIGYVTSRILGGNMIVTQKCAKTSGLAKIFADNADKKNVSIVMAIWFIICSILLLRFGKWIGVVSLFALISYVLFHIHLCKKEFGGITGDLCGMCISICELIMLAFAVIGGIVSNNI